MFFQRVLGSDSNYNLTVLEKGQTHDSTKEALEKQTHECVADRLSSEVPGKFKGETDTHIVRQESNPQL